MTKTIDYAEVREHMKSIWDDWIHNLVKRNMIFSPVSTSHSFVNEVIFNAATRIGYRVYELNVKDDWPRWDMEFSVDGKMSYSTSIPVQHILSDPDKYDLHAIIRDVLREAMR